MLGRLFEFIFAHSWLNRARYFSLKNLFCGKSLKKKIIGKDGGSGEDVKIRIAKAQGVFFTVEKSLEE